MSLYFKLNGFTSTLPSSNEIAAFKAFKFKLSRSIKFKLLVTKESAFEFFKEALIGKIV